MYASAFALRDEPFSPTPDPRFLYMALQHVEALSALEYGLRESRGFVTLVGEVGTGKTTTLYTLLQRLSGMLDSAYVSHTTLPFEDLLRSALVDLGLRTPGERKGELVETLNRFLHRQAERGRSTALVVDEAQNLSTETLEELRLLTNFETFDKKLLQLVLVGQPELEERLAEPRVRQLRERVAVRAKLGPLTPAEVVEYVTHRLTVAGHRGPELFSSGALKEIAALTGGNPRRINTLCHQSLLLAFARRETKIRTAMVREAARELEPGGPVRAPARLAEPLETLRGAAPAISRAALPVARQTAETLGELGRSIGRPRVLAWVAVVLVVCLGLSMLRSVTAALGSLLPSSGYADWYAKQTTRRSP